MEDQLKLVINSPKLKIFVFRGPEEVPYTLDVSQCTFLRILKLVNLTNLIRSEWLEGIIRESQFLEEFDLINCDNTNSTLKVDSKSLKMLTLHGCKDLRDLLVLLATNLCLFDFKRSRTINLDFQSNNYKGCSVILRLDRADEPYPYSWFYHVQKLLQQFKDFQDIRLSCDKAEDIILPESFCWAGQDKRLSQMRHLAFEAGDIPHDKALLTSLLTFLFWFCPKPLTLSFYSVKSRLKRTLKFQYGELPRYRIIGCSYYPKCWRQFELAVEFEGFHDDDHEMKTRLTSFFSPPLDPEELITYEKK